MTSTEKQLCHITARALRLMAAQGDAESDGDHDLVRCLDDALGRLAAEAQRLTASVAEPAGHDMADVNRVVAALIPDVSDEGMTIASAQSAWMTAHAEKCRAEIALDAAEILRETQSGVKAKARHIKAMRDSGHALLSMAEAELDLHLATMTPQLAAELETRLESIEILEGRQ